MSPMPPTPTTPPNPPDPAPPQGGLAAALDRVGDRWSLLLVEALLPAPRRFNELGETVPGIAPNILSDRLRRLERAEDLGRQAVGERRPAQDGERQQRQQALHAASVG